MKNVFNDDNGDFSMAIYLLQHTNKFLQIAETKIDRAKHELNKVTKYTHFNILIRNHDWAFSATNTFCQNDDEIQPK